MSDDIRKLKQEYRGIRAPAHLATRIRAETADQDKRRRTWLPAMATVAVAVAALTVTPMLLQQQADQDAVAPKPTSLSALSGISSQKPAVTAPSLSKVKSVTVPALPRKPQRNSEKEPRSYYDIEDEHLKEKDHAYS